MWEGSASASVMLYTDWVDRSRLCYCNAARGGKRGLEPKGRGVLHLRVERVSSVIEGGQRGKEKGEERNAYLQQLHLRYHRYSLNFCCFAERAIGNQTAWSHNGADLDISEDLSAGGGSKIRGVIRKISHQSED